MRHTYIKWGNEVREAKQVAPGEHMIGDLISGGSIRVDLVDGSFRVEGEMPELPEVT